MRFFLRSYLLENLIKMYTIFIFLSISLGSQFLYEEMYASKHFVSTNFIFAIKLFFGTEKE